MRYILLAAGKGTRLHPLTKKHPKCLFDLDEDLSVAQMMVDNIRAYDPEGEIIIVTGFMHKLVESTVRGEAVKFIYNPFYDFTNSIASLWFAKDYLEGDVTVINADIVVEGKLMKEIIARKFDYPLVLVDSSIKIDGNYNVQIKDDLVVVMSEGLKNYYGEYAGITKLNPSSADSLRVEVESMLEEGYYDQWYENALVQMIFDTNFKLSYSDICDYSWTEVDCVDKLLKAKEIYSREKLMNETALKTLRQQNLSK